MESKFFKKHLPSPFSPYQPKREQKLHQIEIQKEIDILKAANFAGQIAEKYHLTSFQRVAFTTVAAELSRNIYRYAKKGKVVFYHILWGKKEGLRAEFIDEGPGIANIELAMTPRKSSQKSLGIGLSGSRELVDEFEIFNRPEGGLCVKATLWKR